MTNGVRFADVTAAIINAGFRNLYPLSRQVPDLASTRVWVLTGDGQTPTPGTPVAIWKVQASPPFSSELLFQGVTGSGGDVEFAWNGQPDNFDNLILIKAWPTASPPVVKWFSFYDAQEHKMVYGYTNLNIYVRSPMPAAGPLLTIRKAPNAIVVSWPADALGYSLQATSNLSARD